MNSYIVKIIVFVLGLFILITVGSSAILTLKMITTPKQQFLMSLLTEFRLMLFFSETNMSSQATVTV